MKQRISAEESRLFSKVLKKKLEALQKERGELDNFFLNLNQGVIRPNSDKLREMIRKREELTRRNKVLTNKLERWNIEGAEPSKEITRLRKFRDRKGLKKILPRIKEVKDQINMLSMELEQLRLSRDLKVEKKKQLAKLDKEKVELEVELEMLEGSFK
jgi:hypothetical protein